MILHPVPASAADTEDGGELPESFSLSLETPYGILTGFGSKNNYSMFLPPAEMPEELVFTFTGDPVEASQGKLNRMRKTLTVSCGNDPEILLKMADGQEINVKIMRSSVPAMFISMEDTDLQTLHRDKTKSYGLKVSLLDPDHPENCFMDDSCTMHGRGNSSWAYFDKKGYLLKLGGERPVLGMHKAKKWCLVAGANDGTLMKNRIAYEAAKAGGFAYVPDAAYVDLWINGDYRGLYLITERISIGRGYLDLRDRNGVIMELDNMFYPDNEIWFESDVTGMHYAVKDAVSEGSLAPVRIFKEKIERLETLLHTEGSSWEDILQVADMDSFAEYYLLNEMLLNKELLCTSFYLYMDGEEDVIHAGPVWDFDTSMDSTGDRPSANALQNMGSTYHEQTDLFALLCTRWEFVHLVFAYWNRTYEDVMGMIPAYIRVLEKEISASAEMNFRRYPDVLDSVTIKGDIIGKSFSENLDALCTWLEKRVEVFVPARQKKWAAGETGRGGGAGIMTTESFLSKYALVFDPEYYASEYPEVCEEFGAYPGMLLLHYLKYGVYHGINPSRGFNAGEYMKMHPELKAELGNDPLNYVEYYIRTGGVEDGAEH